VIECQTPGAAAAITVIDATNPKLPAHRSAARIPTPRAAMFLKLLELTVVFAIVSWSAGYLLREIRRML
jgi:hypothetical protein